MLTTFTARLASRTALAPDVYLFRFMATPETMPAYLPGQYFIVMVPQPNGQPARRLYSVASHPDDGHSFELVVKLLPNGVASIYLMGLAEGDEATFQGPAGIFTLKHPDQDIVFMATGTGYAPIRSMLSHMLKIGHKNKIKLFWGFPAHEHTYFLSELESMAATHPSFEYTICLSREQALDHILENAQRFTIGRITDVWARQTDHGTPYYYICGGREVVDSVRTFLLDKGIPKERIHFEKF